MMNKKGNLKDLYHSEVNHSSIIFRQKSAWQSYFILVAVWKRKPIPYVSLTTVNDTRSVLFCWLEWAVIDRSSHEQIQVFLRAKQKSEKQQKHLPPCLISLFIMFQKCTHYIMTGTSSSQFLALIFRCFLEWLHASQIMKQTQTWH